MNRHRSLFSFLLAALVALSLTLVTQGPVEAKPRKRPAQVSLRIASASVMVGTSFDLKVKARPKSPGTKVVLQSLSSRGEWTTIRTGELNRRGRVNLLVPTLKRGSFTFRACVSSSGVFEASCSPSVRGDAYQWKAISTYQPLQIGGIQNYKSATINGVAYPNSLIAPKEANYNFREYDISRDCLKLRMTVGLADPSQPGGQATIAIRTDDVVTFTNIYSTGQAVPVSLDIRNVGTLRFETSTQANGINEYPAYGSPSVLCRR